MDGIIIHLPPPSPEIRVYSGQKPTAGRMGLLLLPITTAIENKDPNTCMYQLFYHAKTFVE